MAKYRKNELKKFMEEDIYNNFRTVNVSWDTLYVVLQFIFFDITFIHGVFKTPNESIKEKKFQLVPQYLGRSKRVAECTLIYEIEQ